MSRYTRGQQARVSATFRVAGIATDPGTVTLRVQHGAVVQPARTFAGGSITKDATGMYHADIDLDAEGRWSYRFEGTAPAIGAGEGSFSVRSEF